MLQQDSQLEAAIKTILNQIYRDNAGTIVEMLKPQFVTCNATARTLTLQYQMQPWQCNGGGIMHGGIIASILDQTMGTLIRAYVPEHQRFVTAEMSISYLRQVEPGDVICSQAEMISFGRTLIRIRSLIQPPDSDRPNAIAHAVFAVTKPRDEM